MRPKSINASSTKRTLFDVSCPHVHYGDTYLAFTTLTGLAQRRVFLHINFTYLLMGRKVRVKKSSSPTIPNFNDVIYAINCNNIAFISLMISLLTILFTYADSNSSMVY